MAASSEDFLRQYPPTLREEPEVRALAMCMSREGARFDQALTLVRAELLAITATGVGLAAWEQTAGFAAGEGLLTPAQRSERLVAGLQASVGQGRGEDWERSLIAELGPGTDYAEHDPADSGSPDPWVVRIFVLVPPNDAAYEQIRRRVRRFTRSTIGLEIVYARSLRLDVGELDVDEMT